MRDPHVEALYYGVSADEGTEYIDPEPMSFTHTLGEFSIADRTLTLVPAEHFASERQARDAIGPYLRTWEVETDLTRGPGTIRFEFQRSTIVDRAPPAEGGNRVIEVEARAICVATATASAVVGLRRYPDPPTAFGLTSEVETVFRRWCAHRDGGEPILSFTYFLLTLLESRAGGRRAVALSYCVDLDILNKLGELTAERGDVSIARKVGKKNKRWADLTGVETQWLQEVVRRLVRRLGEHAHGGALEQITVNDFPLP